MKIRYIVIEREYGSGGTEIAALTAEKCKIHCYGPEILRETAAEHNLPVQALEDYEERVSGSLLYSMFVMSQSQTGDPDLLSGEGKLFVAESRMIRRLAGSGPAIFVGHCAAKALEGEKGVLRVFIHAGEKEKYRRITEEYGINPQSVAAQCRKVNRRRANYYHFCTGKHWESRENYDLVLDSSTLGIEGCANALTAIYQTE